jgi:hypothetical protein
MELVMSAPRSLIKNLGVYDPLLIRKKASVWERYRILHTFHQDVETQEKGTMTKLRPC